MPYILMHARIRQCIFPARVTSVSLRGCKDYRPTGFYPDNLVNQLAGTHYRRLPVRQVPWQA